LISTAGLHIYTRFSFLLTLVGKNLQPKIFQPSLSSSTWVAVLGADLIPGSIVSAWISWYIQLLF